MVDSVTYQRQDKLGGDIHFYFRYASGFGDPCAKPSFSKASTPSTITRCNYQNGGLARQSAANIGWVDADSRDIRHCSDPELK